MNRTARRMDIDLRIGNKSAKQTNKKKLPTWFRESIKNFETDSPNDIDKELAEHGADGADVVSITAEHVPGAYGTHGTCYRVFYRWKL